MYLGPLSLSINIYAVVLKPKVSVLKNYKDWAETEQEITWLNKSEKRMDFPGTPGQPRIQEKGIKAIGF